MMLRRSFSRVLAGLAGLVLGASASTADVKLPAIIGSNMVLQRDMALPIWGWADAGEEVSVSIAGQTHKATAGADGKWSVKLAALKVSDKPQTMTIKGKNSLELGNILVGEVWLASGQSNMQWGVNGSLNPKEEIAAAKYPNLRLFSAKIISQREPQKDTEGKWSECSPASVAGFSAVGYFFGRHLHKELNVPVAIIHSSLGGTLCEAWTKQEFLESDPDFKPILDRQANADAAEKKAREANQDPKKKINSAWNSNSPTGLYNGMIAPLVPFAIRGAIWYQGESNLGRAQQYRKLFPTMIRNWRQDWNQGDFPFLFVQLAPYRYRGQDPATYAELCEAQTMTLTTSPNTGMAVTNDIGNVNDIHPQNKQDVGKRLALNALAKVYGRKELVYSGPIYKSMEKKEGKIVLHFDHVGGGLAVRGGGELSSFTIAGADQKFVPAKAEIVGNTVVVSSPDVADPVAARHAWRDDAAPNLVNKEGLPASLFRTDDWKGLTDGKK